MPMKEPPGALEELELIVRRHPGGVSASQIAAELATKVPLRTLQYRLQKLARAGRLRKEGDRRWARYHAPSAAAPLPTPAFKTRYREAGAATPHLSEASAEIRRYLQQPHTLRRQVGYEKEFLESYRPGVGAYLSDTERAHLHRVGRSWPGAGPAGTFARTILNRLLIDLSWNSSRLEGNTYSLLDTRRLIEFGQEVSGGSPMEAQMILNHKEAIEFLVNAAETLGFNRYTVLNLHAILARNLLLDEKATGKLRTCPVGIGQSAYYPPEMPQLIEQYFDQVLETVAAISDPFEQSLFLLVQLPYLQPFEDVNKRVSRLASNIPFLKANLSPLSFNGVSRELYTEAVLGVYELNRIDLLKDLFIWAYEQSAERYTVVRQTIGEPDPFKLYHREAIRRVVQELVLGRMGRRDAAAHIESWTTRNMELGVRERFREVVESEILSLHEGNFARYRIAPADFEAWWQTWGRI